MKFVSKFFSETNKKSNKQQRQEKCIEASGAGVHDPDSRKVFVSGLPFDIKTKEVQMYFEITKNH